MKFGLLISLLALLGCRGGTSQDHLNSGNHDDRPKPEAYHPSEKFNDYWYNGQAELTSFHLEQARYGQMNEGHATLIFVTEHLNPKSLVKTTKNTEEAIPVLKLNFMRKFLTGIYPYSLMTSTFTPVNRKVNKHTLKESFSAQEWCGHVFEMLKWNRGQYKGQLHSYFAGEADQSYKLKKYLLEDELWNLIRIDTAKLPTGSFQIIPSLTHIRLAHVELKSYEATGKLSWAEPAKPGDQPWRKYTLAYKDLERTLSIYFEKAFPHRIMQWEEKVKSGFGDAAKPLKTVAIRKKTILLDYWTKNGVADSLYRKQLGY